MITPLESLGLLEPQEQLVLLVLPELQEQLVAEQQQLG
jgi:hypothetical protein